jgi:hypothetical protein
MGFVMDDDGNDNIFNGDEELDLSSVMRLRIRY